MDYSSIANNINYRYTSNAPMFQFGGLSSGLDTASIIDKIMEVESQPLNRLNEKFKTLDYQQQAYNRVSEHLRDFMDYLTDFKLQSNLVPKSAAVSDSTIVSATASATILDGTYSVNIDKLASRSIFNGGKVGVDITATDTYANLDHKYTPQDSTVVLTVNGTDVNIDIIATDTINDIVTKISNAFTSAGSSATVTFDDTENKLIIQSSDVFSFTQTSGNFLNVFRLDDANLVNNSGTYTLQSTGDIGTYSTSKTLADLGVTGSGSFTINNTSVTYADTDTLSDLISRINSTVNGVTASYDEYNNKIIISADDMGDVLINISGAPSGLGLDTGTFILGEVGHATLTTDSGLVYNLYSDNNVFSYNGLEFTAYNTGNVTISVNTDTDSIVEKVKEFVDKWNETMDFLYTKLTEDKVTNKDESEMSDDEKIQGYLKNDQYLRKIFDKMRSYLYNSYGEHYLWELGISSGDSGSGFENTMKGHIELDEDKLRDYISKNGVDSVWEFFGTSETGFAEQVKDYLYELTKFNGEIDQVAGISGRIEREKRVLAKQMANWIEILQKKEQDLWKKFSAMEEALARLNAQGMYIAQALSKK
ncbi:flagellar hook protein [Thermosipho melanesiensis]|uniref:Flagellar hook-associated protein 2 n=2 Tax=Thermosipho melanesiensis TaxID=46541 RepID=A6LN44_THEM4|nr:flagellar filament capping protein FliD [Thermosipho melanesiensis]ABR31345.1 flagellar hook-associated 2 domain protein [Thermosipho melanesiensis BI429]APT74405.1 flagellar hook protein FliD [Thermosipho melanesiensis]OOC36368.1 flagellar hook protein [Thermosipho melanesiensis]OOC37186.1 flagellar hook protein [Thermosipho melanesiensis]OOC37938.1 flagellar hook protein [Thermosipho melanesiensis]